MIIGVTEKFSVAKVKQNLGHESMTMFSLIKIRIVVQN